MVILLNLTCLVTVLLKLAIKEIIGAILDQKYLNFFLVSFVQKWVLEKFLFHAMFTDGFVNNGD